MKKLTYIIAVTCTVLCVSVISMIFGARLNEPTSLIGPQEGDHRLVIKDHRYDRVVVTEFGQTGYKYNRLPPGVILEVYEKGEWRERSVLVEIPNMEEKVKDLIDFYFVRKEVREETERKSERVNRVYNKMFPGDIELFETYNYRRRTGETTED